MIEYKVIYGKGMCKIKGKGKINNQIYETVNSSDDYL